MENLQQQNPKMSQPPGQSQQTLSQKKDQLKSSASRSSESNSASDAAKKAAAKLNDKKNPEKKNQVGRPPKEKTDVSSARSEVVKQVLDFAPAVVVVIYKQIADKLADAWKADRVTKEQLDNFQTAVDEWFRLEEWKFDPLWTARVAVVIAAATPIVTMHPKFTEWLMSLIDAKQNTNSAGPQGIRKDNIRPGTDQIEKKSDSPGSSEGIPARADIHQLSATG